MFSYFLVFLTVCVLCFPYDCFICFFYVLLLNINMFCFSVCSVCFVSVFFLCLLVCVIYVFFVSLFIILVVFLVVSIFVFGFCYSIFFI